MAFHFGYLKILTSNNTISDSSSNIVDIGNWEF